MRTSSAYLDEKRLGGISLDLGLDNAVAVVTGGSSGIGFATAQRFLAEGARVVICGRGQERLEDAAAKLNAGKDRLLAVQCDVLDQAAVESLKERILKQFGQADILVNNAGTSLVATFAETTDEQWEQQLKLKFFSVIYPTRVFTPLLKSSEIASIVCVNSLLGVQPEPHMVCTSATRGGVANLIKSLSVELAPEIRVNSILVGIIESGQWHRRYEADQTDLSQEQWLIEEASKRYIPLKRFGKPEDAADSIVFLSSARASYLTGIAIEVSGGTSRHI